MSQRTILIIDDDDALRAQLQELFRLEGYNVLAAADGLDALRFLAAEVKPDLVLLDMHMPGVNGEELAAELQALDLHYPMLVLTADADPERCALRVGGDGYLAKPFNLPELLAAVERLLDRQPRDPVRERWLQSA